MENLLINKRTMKTRDWMIDGAVMLVALFFAIVQMYVASSPVMFRDESFRNMAGVVTRDPGIAAYVLLIATVLPLVLRRRFPWPVLVFTFTLFVMSQGLAPSYSFSIIGPAIVLFTIAVERPRTEIIIALAISIVVLFWMPPPGENDSIRLVVVIQNATYLALSAGIGVAYHMHRSFLREVEQRVAEVERTREKEAARRVEEERVRIAREIHDITAHSLSAVSIQAAAAERLIDRDPAAARGAIAEVRKTAKSALEEIRSMIGVLRNESQEVETNPTNGTDRLPDLCAYACNAGLEATLETDGYDAHKVPAYVDVTVFGIAREALTNVVRHAQAKKVRITLSQEVDQVHLRIEDDGCGIPEGPSASMKASAPGSTSGRKRSAHSQLDDISTGGHGLQGMEERVYVLHGSFSAANRPQGGFAVDVRIPLQEGE